jgi:hypothetical protein
MNTIFKLFKFNFLLFKKYYYENNFKTCYSHTHLILSFLILSPFVGLILAFGIEINLCKTCDTLVNKLILMPFVGVFYLIIHYLFKWAKFKTKIQGVLEKDISFKDYSFLQKILFFFIDILLAFSGAWLPILIFEIFG